MMQQHFAVNLQYCNIAVKDCCNVFAIYRCCMRYIHFTVVYYKEKNIVFGQFYKSAKLKHSSSILSKYNFIYKWHTRILSVYFSLLSSRLANMVAMSVGAPGALNKKTYQIMHYYCM